MKPPQIQKIIVEDFPSEDQSVVRKIATSVNQLADTVVDSLSRRISVNDNLDGEIKTLLWDGQAVNLAWSLSRPKSITVGQIVKADTYVTAVLTGAPHIQWSWTGSHISIQDILTPGITVDSSNKYQITLLILT